MAEDKKQPIDETPQDNPAAEPKTTETKAPDGPPDTWEAIYKSDRFKQLLQSNKDMKSELAQREADAKKAEEERLEQQEEWRKLAEQRGEALADAERKLAENQIAMLRQKVAQEAGLPNALAMRLQGTTEEELTQDAQELAKLLPKKDGGLPPTPKPKTGDPIPDEEKRKRAFRSRL